MSDGHLRKLVRQHAHTARLLGVDFVPAYRVGGASTAANVPDEEGDGDQPAPGVVDRATGAGSAPPRALDGSRAAAQAALDALRARYEKDAPHRTFVTNFKNIVWGEGDPCAPLMFVGEAPGEEEDNQGRPFVGRSGQLLDNMIRAMGLSREAVYIANVLKTRPIDNATPTTEEIEACKPYLLEQIAIIGPRVIVTLGKPAAQCLLNTSEAMSAMRGTWRQVVVTGGRAVPVMPTFHPAYLLRAYTPENRAKVWSDLQKAMEKLRASA
jgi:DNA polymerase